MVRRLLVLFLFALSLFAAEKPAPPADLTSPPADAVRGENGLTTKVLSAGTGSVHPVKDSILRVRYTVWRADGTVVQHVGAPATVLIGVPKMIPGWGEATQQMVVGERRRVWVPETLTGGKSQVPLVFDTELVEIVESPVTPSDVAAPPDDAAKTPSGLAYKILRAGTGSRHPKSRDTVVVDYSGWTTDVILFDSSILRGQPAELSLENVIQGWTEGLQLMVEGEKTRFWIPSRLGYGKQKGKPQGMLVFDIELVKIK